MLPFIKTGGNMVNFHQILKIQEMKFELSIHNGVRAFLNTMTYELYLLHAPFNDVTTRESMYGYMYVRHPKCGCILKIKNTASLFSMKIE